MVLHWPHLPTPDDLLISDTSADAARHQKGSMSGRKCAAQSRQVKGFKCFADNQKAWIWPPAAPEQPDALFCCQLTEKAEGPKGLFSQLFQVSGCLSINFQPILLHFTRRTASQESQKRYGINALPLIKQRSGRKSEERKECEKMISPWT